VTNSTRYDVRHDGGFTQPDTIVPGVGANPQALNRYSYARNSPVNYSDPTGHLPGMNPYTVVEERGYFAGIQAWVGDVVGAFVSCQRGCYDRHNDSIAHAAVFYGGDRFDDGKHGDGKLDGDVRRGDFQAVADNKHGNAAEVDQWAAGWLLGRGQYEGYGDNRGWFEKGAAGAVWNNREWIAVGLAAGGAGRFFGRGAVATGAETRLAASRWHPVQRNVTAPVLRATANVVQTSSEALNRGSLGLGVADAVTG